jgi:hypothetical protein
MLGGNFYDGQACPLAKSTMLPITITQGTEAQL